MDGLEICFRVSVQVEMGRERKYKETTCKVVELEGERKRRTV